MSKCIYCNKKYIYNKCKQKHEIKCKKIYRQNKLMNIINYNINKMKKMLDILNNYHH